MVSVSNADDFVRIGKWKFTSKTKDKQSFVRESLPPKRGNTTSDYLIQFTGPIQKEWLTAMESADIEIVGYVPKYAYAVRTKERIYRKWLRRAEVRFGMPWIAAFGFSSELQAVLDKTVIARDMELSIYLEGEDSSDFTEWLQGQGAKITPVRKRSPHVSKDAHVVAVSGENLLEVLDALQTAPDVRFVETHRQVKTYMHGARGTVSSGLFAQESMRVRGLDGEGQIVFLQDSGVDYDHDAFRDDTVEGGIFPGVSGVSNLKHRKVIREFSEDLGDGLFGHGTQMAGLILGHDLADPRYHGIAPLAKLVNRSALAGAHEDNLNPAYVLGARVSCNAYGSDDEDLANYSIEAQAADQFMWNNKDFLLVFAVGNTGARIVGTSLGSHRKPTLNQYATAKNVISVGATGSGTNVPGVNGHDHVASLSSRGLTPDGRRGVTVVAPGVYIVSTASDEIVNSNNSGVLFGQGTSHATALTSGAALLVREYFEDGYYPSGIETPGDAFSPSAALVKGMLIASAQDLGGGGVHGAALVVDSDGDGISDSVELGGGNPTDPFDPDSDDDGLKDGVEDANQDGNLDLGESNPNNPDSDNGGLLDGSEITYGTDVLDDTDDASIADADGDGLTDAVEANWGTLVNDPDSDGDSIPDGIEIVEGSEPLTANAYYTESPTLDYGPDDRQGWGRIQLDQALCFANDDKQIAIYDETTGFDESGESTAYTFAVPANTKSLKVVLCWTDYPALPNAPGLANDLDLKVTEAAVPANVFLGNDISPVDGYSNVGGVNPDRVYTEEVVKLANPAEGNYTIEVDCHNFALSPGLTDYGPQPYSLIILAETNLAPYAVIRAPEKVSVGGLAQMSGELSFDSDLDNLTYSWVYNGVEISTDATFSYSFLTEGYHEVELTVTDEHGLVSLPETHTFYVKPNNLWRIGEQAPYGIWRETFGGGSTYRTVLKFPNSINPAATEIRLFFAGHEFNDYTMRNLSLGYRDGNTFNIESGSYEAVTFHEANKDEPSGDDGTSVTVSREGVLSDAIEFEIDGTKDIFVTVFFETAFYRLDNLPANDMWFVANEDKTGTNDAYWEYFPTGDVKIRNSFIPLITVMDTATASAPPAVTNIGLSYDSGGIRIDWTGSESAENYIVERKLPDGTYAEVAQFFGSFPGSYFDMDASPEHLWQYRISSACEGLMTQVESSSFRYAGSDYETWLEVYFTAAELQDPSISGPLADPDGDGYPNIMEYSSFLIPTVEDEDPIIFCADWVDSAGTYQGLRYTRRKSGSDVVTKPERSSDLSLWNNANGLFVIEPSETIDHGNNTETITIRRASPIGTLTRDFLRLGIKPPAP